ncbi:MAG: branched-chain amino acid ABC transporter substrate-binding protein [Anaerolineae bacterium SM23_84]|nr:MAG: branched-chain amino acid ABC transporter substrate-binding protein [Anaerolineae bacterium SM23_84]
MVVVTPTPPPPEPLPDVIKIGVYEPMTGAFAAGGEMTYEGVELAHEYKSEVLGKPVEIVLVDNKSDKTEAATAMSRLIEAEKVVGVIGSYGSSLSMAGGEVAEVAGVPVVGCSPTNPLVTKGKRFYTRVCFIDPFQGAVIAKYAYDDLGARRVAIIQDVAQDFSIGVTAFFREKWLELSGDPKTLVALTSYQTGDTDFTAQLTYAIGQNPDAIVTTGYYGEAALMAKQARELGYDGPILGSDALDAPELVEIGGDAVEGVTFSTHYHPAGAITPISRTFLDVYAQQYGREGNAFAALGWDAYMLLLDAIERAGSIDGDAIADALYATQNFEGVSGWITLDENGDAVKSAVIKTIKNGQPEFLAIVEPF